MKCHIEVCLTHCNILALRNCLDGDTGTLTLDVLADAPEACIVNSEFALGRSKPYCGGHLEPKREVLNLYNSLKSD